MALTGCGGGRYNKSVWGPFRRESSWDPVEVVLYSPFRSSTKRARSEIISNPNAKRARNEDGAKVDWLETDDAHVFKVDLPGFKKKDIKVELGDDQLLQISGERSQEEERTGDRWHIVERSHGKLLRRFKLAGSVQSESVSAKVEDGVLTVTVPKTQPKTPETRTIEVS
ncbi:unnamed protein product [Calypogeia fissa]